MRLTYKNISFVKRMEMNGITYCWFVGMKERCFSRSYINFENGRTVCREYPAEWLPATVQKFIAQNEPNEKVWTVYGKDTPEEVREYIIRRKSDC